MELALALLALVAGVGLHRLAEMARVTLAALDGFVFVAMAGLVLLHLLPEALAQGGSWSVALFVVGLALPALLEHGLRDPGRLAHRAALVVAIAGVLVHEALDGVALAKGAGGHAGHDHGGEILSLAVILHRMPVALTVWWLLRPTYGVRLPTLVLSIMAAATVGGFLGGEWLLGSLAPGGLAAFQALVCGALLHVVLDPPHPMAHRPMAEGWQRWSALGAGLAVALLVALGRPGVGLPRAAGSAGLLAELTSSARSGLPVGLLALGAGVGLLLGVDRWRRAVAGRASRLHTALQVGLAGPRGLAVPGGPVAPSGWLAPELLVVAGLLVGAGVAAALALAGVFVGLAAAAAAPPTRAPGPGAGGRVAAWLEVRVPALLLGLAAAALVAAALPPAWIQGLHPGIAIAAALAAGLLLPVEGLVAAPLAAALLAAGLAPGAVLAWLVVVPLGGYPGWTGLAARQGWRVAGTLLLASTLAAALAGVAGTGLVLLPPRGAGLSLPGGTGIAWAAAAAVAALAGWALLRLGPRRFLALALTGPAIPTAAGALPAVLAPSAATVAPECWCGHGHGEQCTCGHRHASTGCPCGQPIHLQEDPIRKD